MAAWARERTAELPGGSRAGSRRLAGARERSPRGVRELRGELASKRPRYDRPVGGLQRFEQRLEQLISGVFARAFRSAVQPVEIAAALQRECDNNAQILSRDRRLVPNAFAVELSQSDMERLAPYDSTVARELADQLQEYADRQGYVFPGPIRIGFEAADDLTTGRFRIRSQAQAKVTGNATYTQVRRARAVVEVNGTRHPLQPPGLVVGRGSEADLRINDPGVSRRHAEFVVGGRVAGGVAGADDGPAISVRDLGSTNGMLVDGHKVTRADLRDGSRVQIGNTTLQLRLLEDGAPDGAPGGAPGGTGGAGV